MELSTGVFLPSEWWAWVTPHLLGELSIAAAREVSSLSSCCPAGHGHLLPLSLARALPTAPSVPSGHLPLCQETILQVPVCLDFLGYQSWMACLMLLQTQPADGH